MGTFQREIPMKADGKNATLATLAKAQIEAMFRIREVPGTFLDDSDFVPLLEVLLTTFEETELAPEEIEEIWDYAYGVYDRLCREHAPSFTFAENKRLMRKYLAGPRKLSGTGRRAPKQTGHR